MKLSKAQQEVVDKMREGCDIHRNTFSGNTYLGKGSLHLYTFCALKRKGAIECMRTQGATEFYHLTEKYRTNGTETKPGL